MAIDHYLKAPFDGDSITPGYEKWIELFSFQWGAERVVTLKSGKFTAGKLAETPVTISKRVDRATAEIQRGLFGGPVTLQIAAVDQATGVRVLDLTFSNAVFENFVMAASDGDDATVENVSFQFARVDGVVQPIDAMGKITGTFSWFYDQATAKGG